ncbi:MAG: DUF3131 domain-containing protein [Deltaproteobacteria bacterium]|nr:DUF3131 domain-containing protein [Deltaproteobacteria bacterium]
MTYRKQLLFGSWSSCGLSFLLRRWRPPILQLILGLATCLGSFACTGTNAVLPAPKASESSRVSFSPRERPPSAPGLHPGRNGALTEEEMKIAKVAWKYFENNYHPNTGLVNAVDNYPSTTMWDTASYLGGLVAAYELGLIERNVFDTRLVTLLKTLNSLAFFQNELPNKAYNSKTGEKVDYANKPGEIGYSAIDLGRLLIWLRILKERYPEHGNALDRFVMRWNFCHVLDRCGSMYGAVLDDTKNVRYLQEGRLGYEEYAAKGFQLWGFDTTRASKPEPYEMLPIFEVDIPYDARDPRKLGAHNYVVCESYVLDAVELNWDQATDHGTNDLQHSDATATDFASRIYLVQERRYQREGILTARTEHQLDGAPYFVYDTIYTDGYAWNTITEKGESSPQFAAVAFKAALGLWAVWETPYTDLLFAGIANLYDPAKGYYEGLFENGKGIINTFTANNNGIMLEALLYKVQGKLLRFGTTESLWEKVIRDEFQGQDKCFPLFRERCHTH